MFQFPAFASYTLFHSGEDTLITILGNLSRSHRTVQIFQVSKVGFPIRISTDQRVFAPPRGFSQRITSFIACACQGIHQLPLRHLIVLIANARPDVLPARHRQKRPASRDLSGGLRLGRPIKVPRIERPRRHIIHDDVRTDLLFTMLYRTSERGALATHCFFKRMMFPAWNWWSLSGSNR